MCTKIKNVKEKYAAYAATPEGAKTVLFAEAIAATLVFCLLFTLVYRAVPRGSVFFKPKPPVVKINPKVFGHPGMAKIIKK